MLMRNETANHSNYQDLLKFLAIIAMTIDHIGLYFFPEMTVFRIIGRYAMPIFCFFAGYNFKGSINFLMIFLGVVLYSITTIFVFGGYFLETNILIPIFLGQCYLYLFQNHFKNFNIGYLHFVFIASLWPFTAAVFDYGSLPIAFMIVGYMSKVKSINLKLAAFLISFISIFHSLLNFVLVNGLDIIFLLICVLLCFLSISVGGFSRNINFNIKIISRYSIFIYFFQVVIIGLVWRYYVI